MILSDWINYLTFSFSLLLCYIMLCYAVLCYVCILQHQNYFNGVMFAQHLAEMLRTTSWMQCLQSLTRHWRMLPLSWKTCWSNGSISALGFYVTWSCFELGALEVEWCMLKTKIQLALCVTNGRLWLINRSVLRLSDSMGIIIATISDLFLTWSLRQIEQLKAQIVPWFS